MANRRGRRDVEEEDVLRQRTADDVGIVDQAQAAHPAGRGRLDFVQVIEFVARRFDTQRVDDLSHEREAQPAESPPRLAAPPTRRRWFL